MMLMLSATFTGMILNHYRKRPGGAAWCSIRIIPMLLRHRRQLRHPGLRGGDPRL